MTIAAAALATALSAPAQSAFSAPSGCGTLAEFNSEVERLAGEGAGRAEPAEVLIAALGGGGFELRLRLGDELRVLRDPQCRTLFRSAAVIVAASSSEAPSPIPDAPADEAPTAPPAAVGASPSPAPAAPPSPAPSAPPPAATPAPAAAAPSSRAETPAPRATPSAPRTLRPRRVMRPRRSPPPAQAPPAAVVDTPPAEGTSSSPVERRYGVGMGAGISSGVLPGLGAMLSVDLQLDPEPWGAALSIRYWPERSDTRSGRGLDVSAAGARAAALFRVAPGLHVLGGLELSRLGGSGAEGVLGGNDATAWQFGPTLGANLIALDFQYLRIELGGAARFSLLRPRFVVTGFGDLYRAPPLGGDVILRGVLLF